MSDNKFRIDFRFINVSDDPGLPEYAAIPDPARYEYFKDEEREGYFDKLDPRKFFFDIRMIADLLARASHMPVHDLAPLIDDSNEYIAGRADAIRDGITDGRYDTAFRDATDIALEADVKSKTDFVIMSLDLLGSTKLSQALEGRVYANIIATYSSEVAKMCYRFHGRPLKFMGDGALLYFPIGTLARRHDMAIDCAVSLRHLVLTGLNPALEELGMPTLACRVGVDSGEAYVMTIGDSSTTNHVDIIGEVVNIATKTEKAAPKNGICVGESIVINTHTMWMQHMKRVPLPDEWPYLKRGSAQAYPVYLLDIPASP